MSCIHLHLGQAGNQIGKAFWGLAEEEYLVRGSDGSMLHPARRASGGRTNAHMATVMMRPGAGGMFHDDGFARCLAVDSEPKVVQGFEEQVRSVRPENALYSQSGMANNWAKGFAACRDVEATAPAAGGG
ncbi:unnamed protein product, partial [Sphacelaria rigidula]